jgi:hypothetical protein
MRCMNTLKVWYDEQKEKLSEEKKSFSFLICFVNHSSALSRILPIFLHVQAKRLSLPLKYRLGNKWSMMHKYWNKLLFLCLCEITYDNLARTKTQKRAVFLASYDCFFMLLSRLPDWTLFFSMIFCAFIMAAIWFTSNS